jgi:cell division protein ZapA
MSNPISESIQVNIFDQTFRLRSANSGERMRQIAQLVDERMREIASHTTTFELSKIAVLAALNIADELQTLKVEYESALQTLLAPPSSNSVNEAQGQTLKEDQLSSGAATEGQSWFDAIFDTEVTVKDRSERLSSQVAAKLQALRRASSDSLTIEAEELD